MIVGLDMGGTHIDGVIIKENTVIKTVKKITNREDLFGSIWETLQDLLKDYDKSAIKRINLSTTISTNAIVEDKISKVGMIIQSGPGLSQEFLACGDENQFISGSIDHRGVVVEELDFVEVERAMTLFKEKEIKATAMISKFSTRNPNHELGVEKMLEKEFDSVTLGHRLSGKLNFPRRVYSSYLNSAVYDVFQEFSRNITKSLEKEGIHGDLFILKADGGTMTMAEAKTRPVETILSGPASSFMGITSLFSSTEDAILLDIGGTTTDIFFFVHELPLFEPLGATISKYPTLVRAIYSVSIGLGGDSHVRVEADQLKIGPKREGRPYSFGGPYATPTDAMIYLGLIENLKEASSKRAEEAITKLSQALDVSPKEGAELILNTMAKIIKEKTDELLIKINSKPIFTVKELLHGKKVEPKIISMIGGPAKVLKEAMEKEYQLPCYVPKHAMVANAIGAALAKPTTEITLLADTSQGILTVPEFGIYEKISKSYSLEQGKERALNLLEDFAQSHGMEKEDFEAEIIEESSYNMVRGFYTSGKNIRLKAQIKPGHSLNLRSGDDES